MTGERPYGELLKNGLALPSIRVEPETCSAPRLPHGLARATSPGGGKEDQKTAGRQFSRRIPSSCRSNKVGRTASPAFAAPVHFGATCDKVAARTSDQGDNAEAQRDHISATFGK